MIGHIVTRGLGGKTLITRGYMIRLITRILEKLRLNSAISTVFNVISTVKSKRTRYVR